jgi:hypothetical protein
LQLRETAPLRSADHFEAAMTARIREQVGPRGIRRAAVLSWALAASVAGLVMGYNLPRPGVAADGIQTMAAGWQQLLDAMSSGSSRDGREVLLSFRADDGRYCRLFRNSSPGDAGEGLACRDGALWKLTAWDAATPTDDAGAFRPAGASSLIDAAMAELGGTPALTPEQEAPVIAGGWQAP